MVDLNADDAIRGAWPGLGWLGLLLDFGFGAEESKEVGGSSEVQAVKPMWAMITGKRKKRSGCGTRVGALHASSVCVEEVGGT